MLRCCPQMTIIVKNAWVGVSRSGPGEGLVTGLRGEHLGIDRVRAHDVDPLRPLAVAHDDRDRRADRQPVAVILEAARIFKRLGIRPKHTIRFVFVSGEEELSNGSRAYIERHKSELDDTRAVFNIDCGAHPPLGFKIHGRKDLEAASRALLKP